MTATARTCSIDGCARLHYARGFCGKHYARWLRYGDPSTVLVGAPPKIPLAVRIARFSVPVGDCTEWSGARDLDHYGVIVIGGKQFRAHRIAFEVASGEPIPAGLIVRHKCDNPPCVKFEHLELGTPANNSRDMAQRGRSAAGERSGGAKLTALEVEAIRSRVANGERQLAVGIEYGIGQTQVSRIVNRQRWTS